MKKLLKTFIPLSLVICFIPLFVQAIRIDNPLKWNSFTGLLNAIIDFLFSISIVIAPLMIIVAGFFFVTGGGNPKQIEAAKQMILWILIGLVIIIGAKGLIALFGQIFNVPIP